MTKRVRTRAIQMLTAATIFSASGTPASAQNFEPIFYAYGELMRPWKYLQGRANPYFDRKTDFFGGLDMAKATNFAWMGVTYSPIGVIADDGWRVRLMGGAGRYTYRTSVSPDGINDAMAFSGEVLGGYRKTFNDLWGQRLYVGAFAGVHYEDQILLYDDPGNPARGNEIGFKGSLELYTRVWERYIATFFGTASTVHSKYNAKASLFYELNEMWALGGEFAVLGDARYDEQRLGAAVALTWKKKIIALSGGVLENSGRGAGAYLTLSVYSPF
jgi:hypothetical protein